MQKVSMLLFCLLVFSFFPESKGENKPVGCISLLFYNTENFFHPLDDSIPGDDEFTPEGLRHWTYYRYRAKLNGIARVIYASGDWGPPALTGLCEIENRQVLLDLVNHPLLQPFNLRILHRDSPDPRGIDVAVLYRPDLIRVLSWNCIPAMKEGKIQPTREMLHLSALLKSGDTLDLYVNHWTSKYGGVAASEEKRVGLATQLARVLDSLQLASPGHLLVVTGDLNDGSSSGSVRALTNDGQRLRECIPVSGEGSYKYQGSWELIDHFFVGSGTRSFDYSCELLALPPLLEDDEKFNGSKPFRTYVGFQYNAGYSDHLPILLRLYPED